MIRTLLVALLATAGFSGTGLAQSAPRPMPSYEDGPEAQPRQGGYQDSYDSGDARYPALPPTAGQNGTGQANGEPWARPPARLRDNRTDDEAHRRDRADTADLNRRSWPGRNAPPAGNAASGSDEYRAELAEHRRAMAAYRADQARYAERIARWRARADACERGNIDACEGAQN